MKLQIGPKSSPKGLGVQKSVLKENSTLDRGSVVVAQQSPSFCRVLSICP